jgi:hypothetical protein
MEECQSSSWLALIKRCIDANRIFVPQACAHFILAGTVIQATSCQSNGEASNIHGGSV